MLASEQVLVSEKALVQSTTSIRCRCCHSLGRYIFRKSTTFTDDYISGNFIQYLLERDDVRPSWHEYTHHEFVRQMGDGTLPPATFKYYMIQDYLYLVSGMQQYLLSILTAS